MKIVFVSGSSLADCDFPLIKTFQDMGHDVMIFMLIAPQNLRSTLIEIKEQKPINGIIKATEYSEFTKYSEYINMDNFFLLHRTVKHSTSLTYYNLVKQLIKKLKEFNPDVIHVMVPPRTIDCLLYLFRKKLVLTVHDPFPHKGEQSLVRELFRKIAFKMCPKLVLLNQEQKYSFMKHYKIPENRILINRLGYYDCIKILGTKNMKKNQASKNILFFGRISPYKGIEYLLKAMKIVHNKVPDAKLTIAGSGNIYFDISEYINLDYITIKNYYINNNELCELLANTDITVCPYTDATQSGVILTSFAMNRPVVASNVGAFPEYIDNGKTGILVPPCNVEELANSLISLLTNNNLLNYMKNNIYNNEKNSENSWKKIAQKYIEFYNKVI